jgi:site-specific DNA-methyltransferase (adenine-specific)
LIVQILILAQMIIDSTKAPMTQNHCYTLPFIDFQQMDCFDGLKDIPDNSVDLVATDPPYGIGLRKGYKEGNKLVAGDDGFSVMFFLDDLLSELKRVMKDGTACYIFTRFDVMPYWFMKCKNYFDVKSCIIWSKGGGGIGDLQGNYALNYEMCLYMVKGRHLLNGKREGAVWNIGKCRQEYHETQKPVEVMEKIIEKSSNVGGIVLDPFAGSATTGIACKNLNRSFIGFEMIKENYDVAKSRIDNHCPQGTMFR